MAEDFDISQLNPEDVRDRPNWLRSWWLLLGVVQGLFVLLGADSIRHGWHTLTPRWWGLPSLTWLGGLAGLALGCYILLVLQARRHDVKLALSVILKRTPRPRIRFWDWRHLAMAALSGLAGGIFLIVGAQRFNLVYGGLLIGFALATLPLHLYYVRIWRLAWQIIRQVKAKEDGNEGSGENGRGL